jgi:periplasmic divalent cation tolerance protein
MNGTNVYSVYTTLPDLESARRIGQQLVAERFAACASFFEVESVYRWKGQIESTPECGLVLKTSAARRPELERRLRELHPYELPAIVAYAIAAGLPDYLRWIEENCEPQE